MFCGLQLQDFEMVRVFDSMVFEDEVSDDLTLGLSATGDLDQSQTRQAMHFDGNMVLKKKVTSLVSLTPFLVQAS